MTSPGTAPSLDGASKPSAAPSALELGLDSSEDLTALAAAAAHAERKSPGITSEMIEQRVADALKLKEEGNDYFKKQEFKKAITRYRRVFGHTNGLIAASDEMSKYASKDRQVSTGQQKRLNEVKRATYSNLAACYLKIGKAKEALECANQALELDAKDAKSLLRKGAALIALSSFAEARAALTGADKLEPKNPAIVAEFRKLALAQAQYDKESDAQARKMFGGKLL